MAERFVSIEVTKVILRLNYGVFPAASPRPSRPAAAPACGDIVRVELSLTGARPDPLDVRLIALSAHGEARPVCADRMGPLDMQLALGGDSPGDLDRAGPLDVQLALGGTRAGDLVTVSLAPLARGPPALQPAARRPAPAAAAHAPDGAAKSAVQLRLEGEAAKHGLRSLVFARVPSDYYEQPLEWRAEVLGAPSVAHLCKSIIMENTRFRPGESGLAPVVDGRVKYVLVVVQYIAKLHRERLTEAVRAFEGPGADGKKQYNMRLIDGALSDELSGFGHNAVSPLGLRTAGMPVLIHSEITRLEGGFFWLGGGEVDLKLRFDTEGFLRHFRPIVADVCCA